MSAAKPPAGPPRRRRTWRRRLKSASLSCSLSLLVLAVGLELGARAFMPDPFAAEDELVGMYRNAEEPGSVRTVPGWKGSFTVEGRTVPVELDALGLRSPEIGARRPGELRVLCLGDSFVFGYGVTGDEAFPAVLGTDLAASLGRPVVAGNAGVPGYGTVEQALCMRRLREPFDPDVVVSTIYLGNDFVDDQVTAKYVESGYSMTGPWATLLRRSLRARIALHSRAWMRAEIFLIDAGLPWALKTTPTAEQELAFAGFPSRDHPNQCMAGLFMDVIDEGTSWDPVHPEPVVPRVLEKTAQSLRAIREAAGRAPVLVVLMPSWWHLQTDDRLACLRSVGLDPGRFRLGLVQERLVALCGQLGLPVLDLTAPMQSLADPTSLFLKVNRHLDPEGHRFVAGLLSARIAGMVSDPPR